MRGQPPFVFVPQSCLLLFIEPKAAPVSYTHLDVYKRQLHERGLFTWTEWAATLSGEIKRAQAAGDPDTGETYYRH